MSADRVLVLCRHGNTFEGGQVARMVGRSEDLPLTELGRSQAFLLGRKLGQRGLLPQRILSAPLLRTRQSVEAACQGAGIPETFSIDDRILELDYGAWSGRSDVEIIAGYGETALTRWRKEGVYPEGVGFSPARDDVVRSVTEIIENVRSGDAPVVWIFSSQGVLRFFAEILGQGVGEISGRMRTGAFGIISLSKDSSSLVEWDTRPE